MLATPTSCGKSRVPMRLNSVSVRLAEEDLGRLEAEGLSAVEALAANPARKGRK